MDSDGGLAGVVAEMAETTLWGRCVGGVVARTRPFLCPGSGHDRFRGRRTMLSGEGAANWGMEAAAVGGVKRSGCVVCVVGGNERTVVDGGVSTMSSCSCSSDRTGRLPTVLLNGGWRPSVVGGTMMTLSSGSSVSAVGDVGTSAPFSETVKLIAPLVAGAERGTALLDDAALLDPTDENDAERALPFGLPPSEDEPEAEGAEGLGG